MGGSPPSTKPESFDRLLWCGGIDNYPRTRLAKGVLMARRPGRTPARRLLVGLVLLGSMAALGPATPRPVSAAATFTVNSSADPGDGTCDQSECTLREAIAAANASPGADTIAFDIPGGGVRTVVLDSNLPAITERVAIDGYTQPGSQENTAATGTNAVLLVEIDASDANDGLFIDADFSVVRGLVINRANDGIFVDANDVTIAGCFLGTDPAGAVALGNSDGVAINNGTRLTIGGSELADRNLISGNGDAGVRVDADDASVRNNLIGTDRTGTGNLGNDGNGIEVGDEGALIESNVVAFNDGDGVLVKASAVDGVTILSNSISANGGLGIDLEPGANNDQPAPSVTSAIVKKGRATVRGIVTGPDNQAFTVQIFGNPQANGAEGQTLVGEVEVTTGDDGRATFSVRFERSAGVRKNQAITATATELAEGNSSEFSEPRKVKAAGRKGGR
jgi:CSLREA domain-containing protein